MDLKRFRRKNERSAEIPIGLQVVVNRLFLLLLLIAGSTYPSSDVIAQADSIALNPVIVKGFVPERFMSGLKIQRIDSVTLNQFRFQNLGDLLLINTPIAIKNYGPGQLSTVSFRGTSANHTAVLWNGLNINSPSLGQTDFSTIPVAGFDQLSIQYGSAASTVGTDAIGGSILLNSAPSREKLGFSVGHQQESFRNRQTQVVTRYASPIGNGWNFSGKTSAYLGAMNNHFSSAYRQGYPLLQSETSQKGLIQDLFFQSKNDQEISAHVWLTQNRLVIAPDELEGKELTNTEAYRTMLRYRIKNFTFRTSWVRDVIDYAKGGFDNPDHAVTDKFSARAEKDFEWRLGKRENGIQVKTGGEWNYYRAQIGGYIQSPATENRADFFMLTRWQVTERLLASANLRQALVTRFDPPIAPSLGAEYQLVRKEVYNLNVRGSISKSYRVPTLNERFWTDLGNPDIRPESGWNKEIGLDQQFHTYDNQQITVSLTAYHNRIKDWTYWNPTKNYRVENLQQVLAKGIELQTGWKATMDMWKTGLNVGYAWTRSVQEKAYDAYSADIIGKQLVFVPIHSGNLNAFTQYRNIRLSLQGQSLSKRFSTFDNAQFLGAYTLVHILAESTFSWGKFAIRVQGQINNFTNTFYLNVRNNAMPGRSFAVSLVANYRSLQHKF